jgi:glutathione S-transferase
MKIYGHPWSINTRKTLLTLAEKGHSAELVLVMLPKGEHKRPEHLARHPFGKVPVLDDDGFVLYETRAINQYLDQTLPGPALVPPEPKDQARVQQWIQIADAYLVPHLHPVIVELVFRRFLGGDRDQGVIGAGSAAMIPALDAADRWLADRPYLGGGAFSLADIHWMPYFEYLEQTGHDEPLRRRANLAAWWDRSSGRSTWQRVARSGPQPYQAGVAAEVIEQLHRR